MMYAGIDYHKHYSFVSSLDAEGQLLLERRIHHKAGLFRSCSGFIWGQHVDSR